ncbi:helix-turn-helix transcriptional regulator [Paraburkholderia sp.]|uniref:helix-turn-helix transcriptional regulator n=1 Tax=Paraburkholderia sp. TaxID=1926495 RepID=UPI003D6EFE23
MATDSPNRMSSRTAKSAQDTLLTSLARRVRTLRAQRGMTRKQLAMQSGVSVPYLARVEGGEGNVSIALLHKLSVALNVPMQEFLSDGASQNADLTMLVQFLKQQPPAVLAQLRQQLISTPGVADALHGQRVALIGLRGAGKSTLGALLAAELDAPFIELDKMIEQEAGIAIGEVITLYGQTGMRRLERRCVEQIVDTYPRVVLAPGGGIVAEAATYELLLRTFYTVWLKARPDVHFARVMAQNDARIATAALRREALEHIHRMLDARENLYQLTNTTLDTSDLSIDVAIQQLVGQIQHSVAFHTAS